MPDKKKLDISTWARKEHFNFFKTFEEPYHGVCARIDCTAAYRFAKANGVPFYIYCLYLSVSAAQPVDAFHYRIENDEVFVYDRVDGGSVIDRKDGTFGYGYLPYSEHLETFVATATAEFARVRATTGLTRTTANNIIRHSVLPWIDFTSLSHARLFSKPDSCPFVTFGKMTEHDGKRSMPVSVHAHHALVDGLHVGQFYENLQRLMNSR
jgi:chloramphenicol O-acetyltransferase type A